MAEISKITLPNGITYDIKDTTARANIASAVATETSRAQEAEANRYTKNETYTKEEVNNLITTPNQEYVSVTATEQTTVVTDVLPATGAADTTYRVGNWDGTQYNDSVFSEYAWNGSVYIKLSTKSQIGEVYDISANHADTKYADLAAALNGGVNIPQSLQRGGMSIKFIQSSDNKYVQYRLMADTFNTTPTNWQGVDDEPTAGSENLVKSGGVADLLNIQKSKAASSSASWSFMGVLSKKKVLCRLVVDNDAAITAADVHNNYSPTGVSLSKSWKEYDFSNISSFMVYLQASKSCNITLQAILSTSVYYQYYKDKLTELNTALVNLSDKVNEIYYDTTNIIDIPLQVVRAVNATQRVTGYISKADVLDTISKQGYFDFVFEIQKDSNNGYDGYIYVNNVLKGGLAFSDVEGVITTGKIKRTITASDIQTAGENIEVIWQFGGNDSPACTYNILEFGYTTIKDIASKKLLYNELKHSLDYSWKRYASMIPVKVKKDGTGDFTTIQDAINSITDASELKQYDVQVYDDFYITELTELWKVSAPTQHNPNANNITEAISYIITKNFVHLRGVGRKITIYVESPAELTSGSFQYVHTIYTLGCCIINNLNFVIKGGRYASHDDTSGNRTSADANSIQSFVDCTFEHKGNSSYVNGDGWTSVCALACGVNTGQKYIFKGCKFIAPYHTPVYFHTGVNYLYPSEIYMENCEAVPVGTYAYWELGMRLSDIGSGMRNSVTMIGCNFPSFNVSKYGLPAGSEQSYTSANDVRNGGADYIGNSNMCMYANIESPHCLRFITVSNNEEIDVVGGSAKDLIFGDTIKKYHSSDAVGFVEGSIVIGSTHLGDSQIWELPYRLGNCAAQNKTLQVKVGSTTHTIVFDKNYMTSDGSSYSYNTTPAIGTDAIIEEINDNFGEYFTVSKIGGAELFSVSEAMMDIYNISNESMKPYDLVVRDTTTLCGFRKAQNNEVVEGVVAERIDNISGYCNKGKVIIPSYCIFEGSKVGCTGITKGKLFKFNGTSCEETSDMTKASFIGINGGYVRGLFKNK